MRPRTVWIAAAALIVLGSLVGCASLQGPSSFGSAAGQRPNILFILTDDLRYDALGAYGNSSISTPNLDRLANQGLRLDRFYVASPVCHPSRASFLSGLYPHQENVVRGYVGYHVRKGTKTVATELNRAGYTTGFVGKAHLGGNPHKWGFQEVPAYTERGPTTTPEAKIRDSRFVVTSGADGGTETRTVARDTTKFLANKSIQFVRDRRGEPWFLWLATTAPHSPYFYSRKHPYDLPEDHVPPGFPPGDRTLQDDALEKFLGRYLQPNNPAYERARSLFDDLWSRYYSHVSTMDHHLGRLLKTLAETGQARSTVVILASDNGILHGSHGLMAKGVWYEEAVRVPAIVRWPGVVEPGHASRDPVSSVDFLPTVLRIAGVEDLPEGSEGRSFLPVLRGRSPSRNYAFSEARRHKERGGGFWQMVRGDRFKYVEFRNREENYLFDLIGDPHEQSNLAGDTRYGAVQKKMQNVLERWRTRTD